MATVPAQARTWRRRERRVDLLVWACWAFAAALFIGCFQLISEKTIWAFVWDAPQQAGDLAVRMVPPDWSYFRLHTVPRATRRRVSVSYGRSRCSSSFHRAPSTR